MGFPGKQTQMDISTGCYIQEQYLWKEGMEATWAKSNCHSVSANPVDSELTQGDETLYPNRDDLLGAGSSQERVVIEMSDWVQGAPRERVVLIKMALISPGQCPVKSER